MKATAFDFLEVCRPGGVRGTYFWKGLKGSSQAGWLLPTGKLWRRHHLGDSLPSWEPVGWPQSGWGGDRCQQTGSRRRWDPGQLTEDPDLECTPSPSQWKPRTPLPGYNQGGFIGTPPEERGSWRRKAFPPSSQTDWWPLHSSRTSRSKCSAYGVGSALSLTSWQVRFFFPLMEILLKGNMHSRKRAQIVSVQLD